MDKSTWRSKAKYVAYLQSAFLGFSVILVVLFGILLWDGTFRNFQTGLSSEINGMSFVRKAKHYLNDLEWEIPSKGNYFERAVKHNFYLAAKAPMFVWWLTYLMFVALVGAQWWISGKLMRATKNGTTPDKALRNAITWRDNAFEYLALGVILSIFWLYGTLSSTGRLHETCGFFMIATMIDFIVSFVCYYVISMFIKELEMHSPVYVV